MKETAFSWGSPAQHKEISAPRIEKNCLFGGQPAWKQESAQRPIPQETRVSAAAHPLSRQHPDVICKSRHSPPRGAVFPRGHAVFAAETPDEVGKVVKAAQGRDGAYGVRPLSKEVGGVAQAVVGEVFAEGEAGLAAEDAHEVRVAVVDQAGGVTDGDGLGEMVLDVEQDLLDGVLVRRGWNAFFLTAMGVNGKEKAE